MSLANEAVSPVAAERVVRGWSWTFAAGLVPLLAGAGTLLVAWTSMLAPSAPWGSPLAPVGFTFSQLAALSGDAAAYVELSSSVGGVNIIAAAVGVLVVSRQGLRQGARWAWLFLVFSLVWMDLHDAWSAWRFHLATGDVSFVMPFTFCTLMVIGLVRSFPFVFSSGRVG
ncbi:MAG: hypothetical protein MUC96_23470 [Myxococcaceae bacterium]|jgi:hypothetical protein|nr:hypothetical protein [Myxococcaceae bacterium]